MQLLADERRDARVVRNEGARPGAGRVHQRPGAPDAVTRAHHEEVALALDAVHLHRTHDREVVPPLVAVEVVGHDEVGRLVAAVGRGGRRQVGDPMNVAHAQRRPPVLPRPAGTGVGVEDEVVDAALAEEVRRRETGLPRADHDGIEDGVGRCLARCLVDLHVACNTRARGPMPAGPCAPCLARGSLDT